ncbi:DUF6631 family protein [Providencia rettgeri]
MPESLTILLPERTLTLAGRTVVVHEYTLMEQLQHRAPLTQISQAFKTAMDTYGEAPIPLDTLMDILATHHKSVLLVVAVACSEPLEWVNGLTGEDADALLYTWWGVNAPFFIRNALRESRAAQASNEIALAGANSLPSSLATDTMSANSPITRQDN